MAAMTLTACSQSNDPIKTIDEMFTGIFPEGEPGAAVLIMQGDDIIFDKGYGIADINTKAPIDGETFFNIASISKQFTSTALMQLAEQGKISLDDPVSKYFPDYKADFWNKITIGHLLSHTSGVPDARGYIPREVKLKGDEILATEYLKDLDHLNFEPGTEYEYINPTFVLASFIVEKVTGMKFIDYVKENIFIPAGMDKTLYFEHDKQDLIPNMAHGYEYDDVTGMPEERPAARAKKNEPKNWFEYDYGEETFFATKPDGGIYTCTHQFVNWEKALRNNSVMSEESRVKAQSPITYVSGSEWSDYQNRPNTWYGYGWFVEPKTETTPEVIYHTGDNGGFKALAVRYPESETLVLVFANRTDWDRWQVKMDIEKALNL